MSTPARSARGQERRHQILQAAAELFVDPGYYATSLRDIAAKVGISHAGLLRHYASKGEILQAVVTMMEESVLPDDERAPDPFRASIEKIASSPGLIALVTTAYGSASAPAHPSHEYLLARHQRRIAIGVERFRHLDGLGAGRDPHVEARLFAAVWDGLRLLHLYAPELAPLVHHLGLFNRNLARPRVTPSGGVQRPPATAQDEAPDDRRSLILFRALDLFATRGYAASTMRDIAEVSDIAKSTLFHHFTSKEDVLHAALNDRDAQAGEQLMSIARRSARDALLRLTARASDSSRSRIDNAAFTLLCHEAVPAGHPAHDYFAGRLRTFHSLFISVLTLAQQQGSLAPDRDVHHEATVLSSLWTGAQVQYLYEPDAIDPAALLSDHVVGLLAETRAG